MFFLIAIALLHTHIELVFLVKVDWFIAFAFDLDASSSQRVQMGQLGRSGRESVSELVQREELEELFRSPALLNQ
jgi:hypothetical protein